jgi:hypothetical protein
MSVSINENLAIVKCEVLQSIQVHNYVHQQSSSKEEEKKALFKIKYTLVNSKGPIMFFKYKNMLSFYLIFFIYINT